MSDNDFRVWIGDLAGYNAGRLRGAWFDLEDCVDLDDLEALAETVLLPGNEETYVGDTEGLPLSPKTLDDVWTAYELVEEHSLVAVTAVATVLGESYVLANPELMEDAYRGVIEPGDTVYEYLADSVPETIRPYVDWASLEECEWPHLVYVRIDGEMHCVNGEAS